MLLTEVKSFHPDSRLSSLFNLHDMPLHVSALTNVEELKLEYRRPTRHNHLGAWLGGDWI
jgi:hypothetical protein